MCILKSARLFSILSCILLLASGCAVAPFDFPREASSAISPAHDTKLGRSADQWVSANEGPSGFYPLLAGQDALGARLRLMERAEKSIDIQYFLMKGDTAGLVFAGGLLRAADRGVRIRFLLDDIFSTVEDEELELLDAHPNVELRLYNPVARRGVHIFNFIGDFKRANRRMHNKSFTVDNRVTIVGGRNIADEYFGLRKEGHFLDLDVIGIGPVAADVSNAFDKFWNDERSVPMKAFASRFTPEDLEHARRAIGEVERSVGETVYSDAVSSTLIHDLTEGRQPLYSAEAEVVTDDPSKLTSDISDDTMILAKRLQEVVSGAESEVLVFTPYFVPTDEGVAYWKSVVDNGVKVTLVTNSLASNNHTSVHSGYSRYRKPIIEAGVELYEVRADAADDAGSLTLHTKGMIIDRKILFVGSLNLDPRSIRINSEMGMLIPSESMGTTMAENALKQLPNITYRVDIDDRDKLRWTAIIDGVEVVETKEPLTSGWRRFQAWFLKIVPDSQL